MSPSARQMPASLGTPGICQLTLNNNPVADFREPLMHLAPVAHDVVPNVDYFRPARRCMWVSPEHCASGFRDMGPGQELNLQVVTAIAVIPSLTCPGSSLIKSSMRSAMR